MAFNVTVANLIAGPIEIWDAPTGEAVPEFNDIAPSGIVTPAPTGNWSQAGSSMETFNLIYTPTYTKVNINEVCAAPVQILVEEELEFSHMLAEDDLTNWKYSINAGTFGTTAAGADQTAQDTLVVGSATPSVRSLLLIGTNAEGGSRLVHIFRAQQTGPSEWARGREHQGRAVTWTGLADPSKADGQNLFKCFDITAPASS
jgi:hypothetical protein